MCACCTAVLATTAGSPPSGPAVAATRSTVSIVPSTGRETAWYASRDALRSASPSSPPRPSTSAMASRIWLRIMPELPRAPSSAPSASACHAVAASASPGSRSAASAAARTVRWRLVPVSLSATGKTLSTSIFARSRPSASAASRHQRRTAAASRSSPTLSPRVRGGASIEDKA